MNRPVEVAVGDQRLRVDPGSVRACLHCLDTLEVCRVDPGSIEVAFVDPLTCSDLHGGFFNDPEVTDVMTFPGDPDDQHAGDIAICPQVAADNSHDYDTPFAEELTLYLVHAWLHLAGLRDDTGEAVATMRSAEATAMEHLRAAGCLLLADWHASAE